MLNDLLRIKKIREKKAAEEVRKCRYRVETAAQELEKKKQELVDYKKWRIEEEQRRYDAIMNTQVKQFDLDILKQTVAKLREKDLVMQDDIKKAEDHLEKTKEQLEEARKAHVLATRAVQKFEEFIREQDKELAREQERKEELELEEFTPRKQY
ncbi:MAG: YscO family type III secretion system apparatus protein [Kistimonas sp.]|nr:YscO family type III secretion system apparatus protein [Kistimonas sp.]